MYNNNNNTWLGKGWTDEGRLYSVDGNNEKMQNGFFDENQQLRNNYCMTVSEHHALHQNNKISDLYNSQDNRNGQK